MVPLHPAQHFLNAYTLACLLYSTVVGALGFVRLRSACVHACACARVRVCVHVHVCVRALARLILNYRAGHISKDRHLQTTTACACVRACMRVGVRACVQACVGT